MKFYDFIEYTNEAELLVYKHPCEDFNTSTKLIVREGQQAIFIKNGEICDVFAPGRYKLSTENIPILRKIMSIPTDGESTFSAEVFFISTTNVMSLKWGTSSSMDLQDPIYKVIVKVGACGEASFKVADSVLFIRSLVGTRGRIENNDLLTFFRSNINMHIKNAISSAVTASRISILELNSNLIAFSQNVMSELKEKFSPSGITLTYFTLENVMIPDDDPSVIRLRDSLSKRADMDIIGYSYNTERSFDVMENMAANGGGGETSRIASTIINAGIGLGLAGTAAQTMKNMAQPIVENATPTNSSTIAETKTCPSCGANVPTKSKFCSECGYAFPVKKFCNICGAEMPENSKFCGECGAKKI